MPLPGEVLTLAPGVTVGAEKRKSRPVVVIKDLGVLVLVAPITDANKKHLPTHHLIPSFTSDSQTKDALVATEHAMAVDPGRLSAGPSALSLQPADLTGTRQRLSVALGVSPTKSPPGAPPYPRGSFVEVDFGQALGLEASGREWALVVSNDTGNYFGDHYIVAPVAAAATVQSVAIGPIPPFDNGGAVDIGRVRVVDKGRILRTSERQLTTSDLTVVNAALTLLTQP